MTPPPPACDEAVHLLHCLGRLVAASLARSRDGGQQGALVGPACASRSGPNCWALVQPRTASFYLFRA